MIFLSYVNVNLPRLQRFIQREIDYRESQGQLEPGQLAVRGCSGEAIAKRPQRKQGESPRTHEAGTLAASAGEAGD